MTKRINWKKGMRLTDEILRASDNCTMELVDNAFVMATAGRFGLLPGARPFGLSLNIAKGFVDVESLSCLGVTKGGELIDVDYTTRWEDSFDTRVQIPDGQDEKEYILLISTRPGQWSDTNDGFETPAYTFSLMGPNSPMPANSLPIAHIVDDYGWRMDDIDFVPPCLFVTSHPKYLALQKQFFGLLYEIDSKARGLVQSDAREAIRMFWPQVQQLMITVGKECDTMTPMSFLAAVQKCVSMFVCACDFDDFLELTDADAFRSYVYAPYNYKDCYQRIKEGLDLCIAIREKVARISEYSQPQPKPQPQRAAEPARLDAPVIASDQLRKICTSRSVTIELNYPLPTATVLFTTDGSMPGPQSKRAVRGRNGLSLNFENDFKPTGAEPDKAITLKLIAVEGGASSSVSSYDVILHKDPKKWEGFTI